MFRGVVNDAALPVTLPLMGFVTVRLAKVPTLVSDEASTFPARVAPVKVPAAAGTVISAVPLNATVLMVRGVVNDAALPVTLPAMGFVTVRLPKVPTLVSDEVTTFAARVVPVKAPAS